MVDNLGASSPAAVEFSGNVSVRPLYSALLVQGVPGQGNSSENFPVSVFTTQQSVVADKLINTAATWVDALDNAHFTSHGVNPADEQAAVHMIEQNYYQPYTATVCIQDSIMGQSDARPVPVSITPSIEYNPVPSYLQNLTHNINAVTVIGYSQITRAQLLDVEGSESDYRITWFELPPT